MPRTDSLRAQRLRAEQRLYEPAADGPLSVCLVYPNTYAVAMGNLGFQAVLRQLAADPRVTADRAYLPDGPPSGWPRLLRSFERERPLADFDIVAFSVSFETDYVHVLHCLSLAGVTLRRAARGGAEPLVMAGGPATFLNPEPLAEFVDLFLIGEAEEMLPEFVDRAVATRRDRDSLLAAADGIGGAYRPDRYTPIYAAGGPLERVDHAGAGHGRVVRRYL